MQNAHDSVELAHRSSDGFEIRPGISIASVLKQSPLDPVDSRVLLMHALALTRVQLITQSDREITTDEAQRLTALFERRIDGEPVAYIVGEREFFGLSFSVTPDVLIPRPDTELLVELALERLPQNGSMLDMGTGSGAIAVAVAHHRPDVQVTALDVSDAALAVARDNARQHGAVVRFLRSDWYAALDDRRFDLIVSNPPYIVEHDCHLSQGDLRFEPIDALTDHADGLSALRTIIANAPDYLASAGVLLMEHGYDQADAVRNLLVARGFGNAQSWRDLAGIERVSGGSFKS